MNLSEILLVAFALSVDAMVCSVIWGQRRCERAVRARNGLLLAGSFGLFQFLMPVAGFFAGVALLNLISSWDHWLAFGLLAIVSFNMFREAFHDPEKAGDDPHCGKIGLVTVLMLAIATSLDALAVGLSVAMLDDRIFYIAAVIGIVCFALSLSCFAAAALLSKYAVMQRFMNIAGAAVLLSIGLRVLWEHGVFSAA